MSRMAPTILFLVIGFALGALFATNPPVMLVQAQPPSRLGDSSSESEPKPEPGGVVSASEIGGRLSVIEARGGRDVAGSGDLIGFSHVDETGTQVITLINTQKLWMAVYHIGSSGQIRLASSRAIDADFTLQLNAASPTPEEIRRMRDASPRR